MKIIRSEDEEMFLHSEREFEILRKLDGHKNIVQGVEYIPEKDRSRAYLVMEKISGITALDYIFENKLTED